MVGSFSGIRRAVAVFAAVAVGVYGLPAAAGTATAGAAPRAVARRLAKVVPTDVLDIVTGLTTFADYTKGLSTDGALGQGLAMVGLTPGSDAGIGFSDLVQKAVPARLAAATKFSDLAGLLTTSPAGVALSPGRTAVVTATGSSSGTTERLAVTMDVTRTVSGLGLSLSSQTPHVVFGSKDGASATVALHASFAFGYETTTRYLYLVKDAGAPVLTLGVTANIPDISQVHASIGILAVSLGTGSSLNLSTNLAATFNDPNGDGKLALWTAGTAFAEPDGAGGTKPGELKPDAGSIANIISAGFGTPPGALNATLVVTGSGQGPLASLGSVTATIGVSWPDVSSGAPSVTLSGGLGSFDDFENLTPKDLADGLAHLTTALEAIQRTKNAVNANIDLPFMKGTLADAIAVNESLIKFLHDHVHPNDDPDPTRRGQPDFGSLQELIATLTGTHDALGALPFSISGVGYDPATKKLSFTLAISRHAPAPIGLDAPGVAATSSTQTAYAADGTVADAAANWKPDQWANRTLTSGTSTAIVSHNTSNTITLSTGWHGGQPVNGNTFNISNPDPLTGGVSFGNVLSGAAGILNANASVPVATVQPSYDASVTLVLDLQPAKTGSACIANPPRPGNPANAACPFQLTAPDGTKSVVTQLPTTPDRIMVRTGSPLLTADAPITTQVDIDASVGFLKVHLAGTLTECTKRTSGDCSTPAPTTTHLLSLGLSPLGDAEHDLSISGLFAQLQAGPANVLTATVNGQAAAGVTASVPGVTDFFPAPPTATVIVANLASLTAAGGFVVTAPDFSKLAKFNFDKDNPKALFSALLKTLGTVNTALQSVATEGGAGNAPLQAMANTQIPVVGKSLSDLLAASESGAGPTVTYGSSTLTDTSRNFGADLTLFGRVVTSGTSAGVIATVSGSRLNLVGGWTGGQPPSGAPFAIQNELESAIQLLTAHPIDYLQDMVSLLNQRLGHGSAISFSVDETVATPALVLDLDWKRGFTTSVPVSFGFNLGGGAQSLIGTAAEGVIGVAVDADAHLKFRVPMTLGSAGAADPAGLFVDPASHISVRAAADVGNAVVKANLGPLSIALGDPTSANKGQAQASFSVDLAGTGTAPKSIPDFLSGVGVTLNSTAPPVTCSADPGPTDTPAVPLALCAVFPVYVSTDGTTFHPLDAASGDSDNFILRLPKSPAPSTTFSLTGNLTATSTVPRFVVPTHLATDLANAVLDFNQLHDGIDGYFNFAQQALKLASLNGTLPLVGKDLQQGANFIGNLQTQVDSVLANLPGGGHLTDSTQIKTAISDALNTKLHTAGLLPSIATVGLDLVCSAKLVPPAAPTVTTVGAAATTTYGYQVEAHNAKGDTLPSPQGTIATGNATLDGTNYNHLVWPAVSTATGYKVFRTTGGATQGLLNGSVTGTSYDDKGAAATAAAFSTSNPTVEPCPMASIAGVTLSFDVGQGDMSVPPAGCRDGTGTDPSAKCLGTSVPLDIGLPGLALTAAGDPGTDNRLAVKLGWHMHLKFGIAKASGAGTPSGFFIETNDKQAPEFQVGFAITLPAAMQANIAFLQMDVSNKVTANTPALFAGQFAIDLRDGPAAVSCFVSTSSCPAASDANFLTIDKIRNGKVSDLVKVGLAASVNIDWNFLVATTVKTLPGIGGEFILKWDWSTGDSPDATVPAIDFKGVYIDAGSFFSGVLGPVVKQVKSLLSPLQPVIDQLYAPIPVLSDLSHLAGGPDVNLITMAETFSTLAGGPQLTMVERIIAVIKLFNQIAAVGTVKIPIGDFHVAGAAAKTTRVTPDNGHTLIAASTPAPDPLAAMDGPTAGNGILSGTGTKAGFTFPVLKNPASLFNLLMGQDVDLVKFDSGPLKLGFSYSQQFGPVYAPPPVMVVISGSAGVSAHVVAGFDTYGLRKAFEAKKITADILDSLFLYTTDDNGQPIPVLTLTGELAAGAEVSLAVISVGVEGGIRLTVNFFWNDPDNDGKFRFGEFLGAARNNPLCLFTTSGRLSVFLAVFVTIGIGPFSSSFSFTLADITLLDFTAHPDCNPAPPVLGHVEGNVLYVHAGKLGGGGPRGNALWSNNGTDDENVVVHEMRDNTVAGHPFSGFAIDMIGVHQEFLLSDHAGLDTVEVDAHGYQGKESIQMAGSGDSADTSTTGVKVSYPFDKKAVIFGGDKGNSIRAGDGQALVQGGAAGDQITAGGGNDVIAGAAGSDSVTVGNGSDWVAGDGALTYSTKTVSGVTGVVDPSSVGHAAVPAEASTDGADSIFVGLGANTVYGGGGNDAIQVAPDSALAAIPANAGDPTLVAQPDFIVGGSGSNSIRGGSNADTIYAGHQWPAGQTDPATAANYDGCASGCPDGFSAADGDNRVDTGAGSDTVYGGTGRDFVVGRSTFAQADTFYGGANNDVLVGGHGRDHLFGGSGDDYLSGGPATVTALSPADPNLGDWSVAKAPDGAQHNAKLLVGGSGNDHIVGGDGGDVVYGDRQVDTCVAPPELTTLQTPGSHGQTVVTVMAATGLRLGAPFTLDPTLAIGETHLITAISGNDITLDAGLINDHGAGAVTGEPQSTPPPETPDTRDGIDHIGAGDGANIVSGGGANDIIRGGKSNDLLCGGAGDDQIHGGTGTATAFGGSGNDTLFGAAGNNYLYGNDGNDAIYAGSGNDHIEGNGGDNSLHAGGGIDHILGGSSAPQMPTGSNRVLAGTGTGTGTGTGQSIVVANNGRITDDATSVLAYDLTAHNAGYGGPALLYGSRGGSRVYGGAFDDEIHATGGNNLLAGGPGSNTISGGPGFDDIIGGTTPTELPAGLDTPAVPSGDVIAGGRVIGNTITGQGPEIAAPSLAAASEKVIVGGNGSVTRNPAFDGHGLLVPGQLDPNHTAPIPVRAVVQLDLLSAVDGAQSAGDNVIHGSPAGDDHVFGGLGNDLVTLGNGDNYVEGGPGDNTVVGGPGSNDIIGGTSPLAIRPRAGPETAQNVMATRRYPVGNNVILAAGGNPQAGQAGNVVIADNGSITRDPTWTFSHADPTLGPAGLVQRTSTLFNVYDLAAPADTIAHPNGGGALIFGGSGNDVLLGGSGNDRIFGPSPSSTSGSHHLSAAAATGDATVGVDDASGIVKAGVVTIGQGAAGAESRTVTGVNGTAVTLDSPLGQAHVAGAPVVGYTFDPSQVSGNDYMEGGPGYDSIFGGAGQDDMIGGASPFHLKAGAVTTQVSDPGNHLEGGDGQDYLVADNGQIVHQCGSPAPTTSACTTTSTPWAVNVNDGSYPRQVTLLDLLTIGGDSTLLGGNGNDHLYGGRGNDSMDGGAGDDYLMGGPGADTTTGGSGDDDLVGGTSPTVIPIPSPAPPDVNAYVNDQAANMPDGLPDPNKPGQRIGNTMCGFECGQSTNLSDDDAMAGNNGRIDRCPAAPSGLAAGSDSCAWQRTDYGWSKSDVLAGTNTRYLGAPRTRFISLLGESLTEATHNGNDYLEGNSGNDVVYGQDGNDIIHGDTPAPGSPRKDECLPTGDPTAGQDIAIGGYGADTVCGDGGDDAILGDRGTVTVVPFTGPARTVASGGTSNLQRTFPASGDSIYQVTLIDPNNGGQDILFGGQGDDSVHGGAGDDFIQGDDGLHIAGQTPSTGGNDILFGDNGNDSIEGGPGYDNGWGGAGNDDLDFVRYYQPVCGPDGCIDTSNPKIDDAGHPLAPLFATITAYAARFPLAGAGSYDTDPGAENTPGIQANPNLPNGDILYGGFNRDLLQGDQPNDRLVDQNGNWNMFYVCTANYGLGELTKNRSPGIESFLQQLGQSDGAIGASGGQANEQSSGGSEVSIVYASETAGNYGTAYPGTSNPPHVCDPS